jgi:hypothetical protein
MIVKNFVEDIDTEIMMDRRRANKREEIEKKKLEN